MAAVTTPRGEGLRVTPLGAQADLPTRTVAREVARTRVQRVADQLVRIDAGSGRSSLGLVITGTRADGRRPPPVEVVVDGWRFELEVEDERRAALRERARRDRGAGTAGGPFEIRAIIPGRVVTVGVAAGDAVAIGDRLFVLEAMKMQNELRAPRAGQVGRVAVGEGQTVESGDLLLVLE